MAGLSDLGLSTLAPKLSDAVAAVAPIHGVSIGRRDDKSTWRIDFKEEATDKQRVAAAELLASFVHVEAPAITKRQALLFLLSQGKSEADVEAAIDTIPDEIAREAARIEWRYPPDVLHHDHPLMKALAPAIGLTVEALPDAFRAAATL